MMEWFRISLLIFCAASWSLKAVISFPQSTLDQQSPEAFNTSSFQVASSSSVNPLSGSNKIITTRFGEDNVTPEQQCRCTSSYLCATENVVIISENLPEDQRCPSETVCCSCVNSSISGNTGLCVNEDPSGVQAVTNSPPSTPSGTSEATSLPNSQCTCVQRDQCDSTFTWIDVRVSGQPSVCSSTEMVCCPWNYMLNTSVSTSTIITTSNVPEYQCGRRSISTKDGLLSKSEATFGEFPWMVLIYKIELSPDGKQTDSFVCGGSLLSSEVVLTAAHCVKHMNNDTKVRVGEYDVTTTDGREPKPHQDRSIVAIIQHKQFDSVHFYNDFALLVVSEPFQFDTHIAPICIPSVNSEFQLDSIKLDKTHCVATGWGKNVFGSDTNYPKTLKKVSLPIVDRESCEKKLRGTRLGSNFTLHSSLLCAGGTPGIDACKGDGGGPLVCPLVEDPTRFVQVGITAAGLGCGTAVPGLYANLLDSENLSWLTTQYVLSTPSLRIKLN